MNLYEYYQSTSGNIILEGKSGYGKTYQLLHLAKQISNKEIPLYVDCTEVSSTIWEYIAIEYCGRGASTDGKPILDQLSDQHYNYCVLMDGLDKVSDEDNNRGVYLFLEKISKYSNVRIIIAVTSVDNYEKQKNIDFSMTSYKKLTLQPYSIKKVEELLTLYNLEAPSFEYLETLQSPELLKMVLDKPSLLEAAANRAKLLTAFFRIHNLLSLETDEAKKDFYELKESSLYSCAFNESLNIYKDLYKNIDEELINRAINLDVLEQHREKNCFGVDIVFYSFKEYIKEYLFAKGFSLLLDYSHELDALRLIQKKPLSDDVLAMIYSLCVENKPVKRQMTPLYSLFYRLRFESDIESMIAVRNILGVFMHHPKQLEDFDLSHLDLRATSFIGVNCQNVDFSYTQAVDECFVPIEPKKANLFAVSPEGNYYLTGNRECINLRFSSLPFCSQSFVAGGDESFISVVALSDTQIKLISTKEERIYTLNNENVIRQTSNVENNKEYKKSIQNDNTEIVESTKDYAHFIHANICLVTSKFLLLRRQNAYYLYQYRNESFNLLCRHKFHMHITPQHILQEDDTITFLLPLKNNLHTTLCFNPQTKELFHNQYELLKGKMVLSHHKDNDYYLFFDSANINSLFLYHFYHYYCFVPIDKMKQYNKIAINASSIHWDVENDDSKIHASHEGVYFITDKNTDSLTVFISNYPFSDIEWHISSFGKVENSDKRIINFNNVLNAFEVTGIENLNVRSINGVLYLSLANKEYLVDEKNQLNLHYAYSLKYEPDYEKLIDSFPWTKVVLKLLDWSDRDYSKNELNERIIEYTKTVLNELNVEPSMQLRCRMVLSRYFKDIFPYIKNETQSGKNQLKVLEQINQNKTFDLFLASCFKNWCFPCDNGLIYYNGSYAVYLTKQKEIPFIIYEWAAFCKPCRYGIRYQVFNHSNRFTNQYELYDIRKTVGENQHSQFTVPIYDLYLYDAVFDEIHGLNGNTLDILKQYQKIPTYEIHPTYLDFVSEEEDSDKEKEDLDEKKKRKKRHIFPSFRKKKTE